MVLLSKDNTDDFRFVNGYFIHIFNVVGTRTITVLEPGPVDILVVAGGGSGSNANGSFAPSGGGGGGEVIELSNVVISSNSIVVTVGAGGVQSNGGNSFVQNLPGTIEANGGGMGGMAGGSGGGAKRQEIISFPSVKRHPLGMGNPGGQGNSAISGACGGGGATTGGVSNNNGADPGTPGGQGYSSSYSGSIQVYGSGGGGGARSGSGGTGGTNAGNGGNGETSNVTAVNGRNGINGYGGGGGGGGIGGNTNTNLVGTSGNGGSGVVIIRYYVYTVRRPDISFTDIINIFGGGSNMGSYRSYKANYAGLPSNLPASNLKISDFEDKTTGIVTNSLALWFDPANSNSYPGTGSNVTDLSGSNNNGIMRNGIVVDANQFAVQGSNLHISTSYLPNIDAVPYTYECWFWDDSPAGYYTGSILIGNASNQASMYSVLNLDEFGRPQMIEVNTTGIFRSHISSNVICNGKWTHLVMSASSTNLTMYINAVAEPVQPFRPGGVITSLTPIYIGSDGKGFAHTSNLTYRLGPVRMYYNKALTAAEVLRNYNADRLRGSLNQKNYAFYEYQRFATTSGTLVSSASHFKDAYVLLTQNIAGQYGFVYWRSPLGRKWICTFDWWAGPSTTGADAVWFFAYKQVAPAPGSGEVIIEGGYNFVADEYDGNTYQIHGPQGGLSNAPAGTVQSQGNYITHVAAGYNIASSTWRTMKVEFTAVSTSTNNLKMYVNNGLVIDIDHTPPSGSNVIYSSNLYTGFGARTGGIRNEHRVRNMSLEILTL